ncbi:NrfD/PsrC family molybdoenzyme membrane anchor subunit [Bacteroidota bacterium]
MSSHMKPEPIRQRYFTPTVMVISLLALTGLAFLAARFLFGLGFVTNLDNQHPWGIWIGLDVSLGVALAAGGFTTAALGHIMHKDDYHAIVRPALLTAALGYTFVGISVAVDLGRYYSIWHMFLPDNWNGNSVLFEVGACVMIYLTVLYIEMIPIITERFIGKVNLWGFLSILNKPVDALLRFLDRTLSKTMFIFIIAGVVLSCLHQSSLGTLMVIAGPKMHPLWQTPVLPLLFLISAIAVGFPMVIMESMIASRSFKLKPEMDVLSKLGKMIAPMLGVYLAVKIIDVAIRGAWVYLTEISVESIMFMFEVLVMIIALRMFLSKQVYESPLWLFMAACFVIIGVTLNRMNNFLVAYNPPYAETSYFPSIGEILVTIGFISLEVLIYRAFVMVFPVISIPVKGTQAKTKFAIRGES